jgi:hypothetical protein
MTLNDGQRAAADGFFEFLFSPNKELILSGGGGVGKTFLMGYLIDKVMPQYFDTCKLMGITPEYDEVEMTATTNKAAEVLSASTRRDAKTVASFLSLKVKDDHDTGRSMLIKTQNWKVFHKKILFCDECSMIDPPLRQAILEGTLKCKIIYVGDHCQLAPVGYEMSPIYDLDLPFFELTEPMRNAGQPALMEACQRMRETVETGVFKPIKLTEDVIDLLDEEDMKYALEYVFKQQTRESRIVAYTNARVIEYNEFIRGIRGLGSEYGVGEILVNAQAIQFGKRGSLSVEAEVEIIEARKKTEMLVIEDKGADVKLEVRRCKLRKSNGLLIDDVPLAVDRDHHSQLMKYYARAKNWNRLFYIKNTVPDLRPRDAATVYKVQGSTYDSVFIDLENLSTCNKAPEVARALYVALSRARSRVFLYGQLADRYGGRAR